MKQKIRIGNVVFGLFVIAAGILLFAFDADMLPAEYKTIVFSWQTLLIALGITCLFHKQSIGFVLILIGGFFILPKLNIDFFDFSQISVWAVCLIILGIIILWHVFFGKNKYGSRPDNYSQNTKVRIKDDFDFKEDEPGYIDRNYIFGGSKERIDYQNFKGGEINCIFGGLELDLSNAQLAEGSNILEINTVFGGVVLYIPGHWKIEIRKNQIFGNFEDKRPLPNFEVSENQLLIIKASSIFGGGEIKCK